MTTYHLNKMEREYILLLMDSAIEAKQIESDLFGLHYRLKEKLEK